MEIITKKARNRFYYIKKLINSTNVSILDLEEAGHPVIYINNRKTGAFGWLLPCLVY